MKGKVQVGILFGGRSVEHEVSLQSAKNIVQALDKNKYEVILIYIDKKGIWYLQESFSTNENSAVSIIPGQNCIVSEGVARAVDVIFPVLHGTNGEDGSVQGLLQSMNIPWVGTGVLGSAVGMDKDVAKRLLKEAGIPVAPFVTFKEKDKDSISFKTLEKEHGLPFFVKPANLGSSVGVHKVKTKEDLQSAIEDVFAYDNKIMFETFIQGREIECSVLGNETPIASLPGEVIPVGHEFYTYESKYTDDAGSRLEIPAKLGKDTIKKIQQLAVQTFEVLACEGMARVDFFVTHDNKVYVNEINTIPGFTSISMYPKLWEVSGVSYTELIDRLINLAIERHERQQKKYSY